ncbi:hypothetical protein ALP64_201859 [Pseudomonas syringae pv. actinidiae]|nr:hypothetical protein ALP64_201859 [Pseudomonas syringae pv. actinidiae]
MQVDDFVSDGGHALDGQCHKGRVASLQFELGQVSRCHLAAFTGNFEQAILVNQPLNACW